MKTIPEILDHLSSIKKEIDEAPKQRAVAFVSCENASSDKDEILALKSELEYVSNRFKWIWEDIAALRESFSKHTSVGHLPKIQGAGAMEKALQALGLDANYTVAKTVIYASTGEVSEEGFSITAVK